MNNILDYYCTLLLLLLLLLVYHVIYIYYYFVLIIVDPTDSLIVTAPSDYKTTLITVKFSNEKFYL